MIKAALKAELAANDGVRGMTGPRVFGDVLPQEAKLPAVTVTAVDAAHQHSHSGVTGLVRSRLQVSCWGRSRLEADRLAEKVRLAIDGFPVGQPDKVLGEAGGEASESVDAVLLIDGPRDMPSDPRLENYRLDMDFEIWHHEALPA